MIAFRKSHPELHRKRYLTGEVNERGLADISWHGTKLHEPGWDNPTARTLSFTMGAFQGDNDIHVILNMFWGPLDFELPPVPGRNWYVAIDTRNDTPWDIYRQGNERLAPGASYPADGHSVVVLISK
jgi:glycogen operon protein